MTYSLVARDEETGALGVAVQSHFFGVGALVTWAESGVGAVATQSFAEPGYGPLALELLRRGVGAPDALDQLVAADELRDVRQVAVVDSAGRTAAHTGAQCIAEANHHALDGVSAQANMMERDSVCPAMIEAFRSSREPFAYRLLAALDAAEAEGGDIRGRQSAAILVVGGTRTDRPWEGVQVNLRVDDDPAPLEELRRLVDHHGAYTRVGRALFAPGAVIGRYDLDASALTEVLEDLEVAQHVLGENPEPTVWRGVVLARAGRPEEARREFERAAERNPKLVEFAHRLQRASFVSDAGALPAIPSVGEGAGKQEPATRSSG